ncbi:MAG TPA: carboxypeptidase regulatory-like domain-containing protein, partial [Gemmatimonadaceae bacterium]|nr:carboxypeptidase regulatory-like domain-containing protein [Gemmatimonadaceae bacterium]
AFVLTTTFAFTPARLTAQVGSTTDIILGRVTGPDSLPIENARVEVTSTESGITRNRLTNDKGQYAIVFPDGGGTYTLRVTYLGMAPFQTTIQRQADEDRLVANVQMSRAEAYELAPVVVRGQQRPQQPRPEAGNTERMLPSGMTTRLPVDAGDLNDLATLAPGVIGIAGTDSTPAAFSIAGQPSDQNNITLDGLSFGAGNVPQEALRNTRVITSTYDVGRGQFTGGMIASTTRGGTNMKQGVLNYSFRDPSLEFVEDAESFSSKYRQNQLSGGFGLPIVKDKAFAFGAFTLSRRTTDLMSLLSADSVTLQRLGTDPALVDRFLGAMNGYGIPATLPGIPRDALVDHISSLVRADYRLNESHTLMARGDIRWSAQEATRIAPLAVPNNGGEGDNIGGGGMLTLTSQLGSFINELRAYQSTDRRDADPYITIPDGRVITRDTITGGITTLQFGGNPSLPQVTRTSLREISDEISWISGDGAHRVKLGGLFNQERSTVGVIPNRYGTFTFNSLEDFEANTPSQFTRTLSAGERKSTAQNGALYLGDAWRKSARLQLTYGVRLEASRYPDAPAYNATVEQAFGRRTDRFPSEVHVSPRIGFTWMPGLVENRQQGRFRAPRLTIRGGVGEFRGRAPMNYFGLAREATGLSSGQSQLSCTGGGVPTPDWSAYLADPSTIPTECLLAPSPGIPVRVPVPNVTVFDPDFGAPRAWRASLGVSRRILDQRVNISLDASYARGVSQTGATDLNLEPQPAFRLAAENNRPVFVSPTSINSQTGAIPLSESRVDTRFGFVNELTSKLRSDTRQLTLGIGGFFTRRLIQLNTSYTYTRSRDETLGAPGFGPSAVAGDPRVAEWGRSNQERRHSISGTVMWPINPGFEISAIVRASSGARFTPMVGGDVNGDGARNDRAFIYDPTRAADTTALADGMAQVLSSAPRRARDCLTSQLGTIASRNSCSAPWSSSLDFQLNIRPQRWGLNRRVTFSMLALNALAGLDQLLHDDLRGWGQPSFPDRTLMYVRGFDPATQSFKYEINERFGAAQGSRSAFRSPFQLAVQVRASLGSDPAREQIRAMVRGPGGRQMNADQLRQRMRRTIPNPFRRTLELNDSLGLALTPEQQAALKGKGDTLQVRADSAIAKIAEVLGSVGANPDPQTTMFRMRDNVQAGRRMAEQAARDLEAILTPEQWAKLPANVKNPLLGPGRAQPGEGPVRIEMHGPPPG